MALYQAAVAPAIFHPAASEHGSEPRLVLLVSCLRWLISAGRSVGPGSSSEPPMYSLVRQWESQSTKQQYTQQLSLHFAPRFFCVPRVLASFPLLQGPLLDAELLSSCRLSGQRRLKVAWKDQDIDLLSVQRTRDSVLHFAVYCVTTEVGAGESRGAYIF